MTRRIRLSRNAFVGGNGWRAVGLRMDLGPFVIMTSTGGRSQEASPDGPDDQRPARPR